jgi:hypothetical protein
MLNRTVSYKSLLRVVGTCFLFYGFYVIVLLLTCQIDISGDVQYTGPLIFEGPIDVRNYLFCGGSFPGNPLLPLPVLPVGYGLTPGPLLWISLGMLCLSITSMRVNVVYMFFHIALWFISLSVWFPIFILLGFTDYDPGNFVPFVLVTLACSLVLLACYKPVTHFLRKLRGSNADQPELLNT